MKSKSNKPARQHTVLKVKKYLSLTDFGVIDPYTGAVYDSINPGYFTEISKNLILIDIGSESRSGFEEVLLQYPELNLN